MAPRRVKFTINAFFGDDEIELPFPDNWAIAECQMAGHGRPALTGDQIRSALSEPLGTPRLREMARGKRRVCILFDDLPKPTRTDRIVPYVIEELHAGGIADEQIRFVCAPGTHRPLIYPEFVAKLGKDVVERYLVFNHSIWENLVYKGETSHGTPVWVNREFDSCDLRLGIGSIFPHAGAGYGGGGKIVLPGISGIETIAFNHRNPKIRNNASLGQVEGNVFREDIEEAARLAGLMFKVDVVINEKREAIGLFCGDFVQEHRAGVKLAREVYSTPVARDADVVITNTYPDEGQMGRGHWVVPASLKEGGDVVILTHFHEGQNLHQLSSRFGTDYGGRGYRPERYPNLAKAGRVILMAPFLSKYDREAAGPAEKVIWCKDWGEVLAELTSRHGPGTRVAVYPYAPLQVPSREDPAPEYRMG